MMIERSSMKMKIWVQASELARLGIDP